MSAAFYDNQGTLHERTVALTARSGRRGRTGSSTPTCGVIGHSSSQSTDRPTIRRSCRRVPPQAGSAVASVSDSVTHRHQALTQQPRHGRALAPCKAPQLSATDHQGVRGLRSSRGRMRTRPDGDGEAVANAGIARSPEGESGRTPPVPASRLRIASWSILDHRWTEIRNFEATFSRVSFVCMPRPWWSQDPSPLFPSLLLIPLCASSCS